MYKQKPKDTKQFVRQNDSEIQFNYTAPIPFFRGKMFIDLDLVLLYKDDPLAIPVIYAVVSDL
jgi:hypothetical protein